MIDKIDAKIISKLCTEYRTQYELLLSTQSGEESIIKSAWENEKEEFYSRNFRRFKTLKEIDTYYYTQMVGLLDRVMKENPSLYRACVKELNKTLRTNSSFSKKAGLIVHQDDRYTNTEYFVNYLFSGKALDRCKALLGSFGIK